jgi:hypothetical protein
MMIFHVCGLEILMNDESILYFNWIFLKKKLGLKESILKFDLCLRIII